MKQPKRNQSNLQKVTDLHDTLNVTIQEADSPNRASHVKADEIESQNSDYEQLNSVHDSVYEENNKAANPKATKIVVMEDAETLEHKESAMARYLDSQG